MSTAYLVWINGHEELFPAFKRDGNQPTERRFDRFWKQRLPLSSIAISATAQTCPGIEGAGEDTFRLNDDSPGSIETCDTGPLSPRSPL
jgi:hypothetical protein